MCCFFQECLHHEYLPTTISSIGPLIRADLFSISSECDGCHNHSRCLARPKTTPAGFLMSAFSGVTAKSYGLVAKRRSFDLLILASFPLANDQGALLIMISS